MIRLLISTLITLAVFSLSHFIPASGKGNHVAPIAESIPNKAVLEAPKAPLLAELDKAEQKAVVTHKPAVEPNKAPQPVVSDSCDDWKAQAGIPDTHATRTLINNESGCKWWAVNPKSGACGIGQAYPCGKMKCPLTKEGAVCQLKWMQSYIYGRYGSWEKALSFWHSQCGSRQGCWY